MKNTAMPKAPQQPWWREPMMWLVVGGPLAVVVASFWTLALALLNPDPVLLPGQSSLKSDEVADLRSMPGRAEADAVPPPLSPSLLPAMQARNHAATGGK